MSGCPGGRSPPTAEPLHHPAFAGLGSATGPRVAAQTLLPSWSRSNGQKVEGWPSKNIPPALVEDVPLKVAVGLQGSWLQLTC